MRTQFVIRLRGFPDFFLGRQATASYILNDKVIQERIKRSVDNLKSVNRPIPQYPELLKEVFGFTWGWKRGYDEFGKAKIFTDIKEVRRAFSIASRRDKTATFNEYEVIEYEIKEFSALLVDQFMSITKPAPKQRKKKSLIPATTP